MNSRSPCQSNHLIFLRFLFFPKTLWGQVQILLFTFRGKGQAEDLKDKINLVTEKTGAPKSPASALKSTPSLPRTPLCEPCRQQLAWQPVPPAAYSWRERSAATSQPKLLIEEFNQMLQCKKEQAVCLHGKHQAESGCSSTGE